MLRRVTQRGLNLVLGLLLLAGSGSPALVASAADGGDAAWAAVRAAIPAGVPVYRPTSLPARFQQQAGEVATGASGVPASGSRGTTGGYRLAFVFGGANSAEPTRSEPVTVQGNAGMLTFSNGTPTIQVSWTEVGLPYSIRGDASISRAEILQIAASSAPVGADGRAIAAPGLPNTGGGAAARGAPIGPLGAMLPVILLGWWTIRRRRA